MRSVKIETETDANLKNVTLASQLLISTRSTQVKQDYRQCQFICFDFGVHGSLVTKIHVSNTMIYCTIKYSFCVISCKFSAPVNYLSLLMILSPINSVLPN